MSAATWAGVVVLGGLGAVARLLVDGVVSARTAGAFPAGTLAVNASGAALLGLLTGLAVHGDALVLAGGAALGSYTTFSTWMLETQRLGEEGEARAALANLGLSLAVGFFAAWLGRRIGTAL